jgi:hypothetical protein
MGIVMFLDPLLSAHPGSRAPVFWKTQEAPWRVLDHHRKWGSNPHLREIAIAELGKRRV